MEDPLIAKALREEKAENLDPSSLITWNWYTTDRVKPEIGVPVLGLMLNQPVNQDWSWSGPVVVTWDTAQAGHRWVPYGQPYVWASIAYPQLPTTEARTRAAEFGKRFAALEAKEAELQEERSKLMQELTRKG